jgi:hypothetical protein
VTVCSGELPRLTAVYKKELFGVDHLAMLMAAPLAA